MTLLLIFDSVRQRALFNVLRAFASYDEEVGYCQGMTNIAATILMYCEEEVNRDGRHHVGRSLKGLD